jgi:hypothetical protein
MDWEEYDSKHVESSEFVKCVKETPKAILVNVGGEELWFPKSQLSEDNEVNEEGDEGVLIISLWIAEQKGLV